MGKITCKGCGAKIQVRIQPSVKRKEKDNGTILQCDKCRLVMYLTNCHPDILDVTGARKVLV